MRTARCHALPAIGLAFAALLAATPVAAVDRYVSPAGSGTTCSAGSPCALATANTAAVAGDVVRMRAGNYGTGDINPSNNGTSGSRIIYRPDTLANPVNVDQIVLASGRSYVSVWSVRTTNVLGVNAAQGTTRTGDSLVNVVANKPVALHDFANSVFYNCVFGDTTTTLAGTEHVQCNDWNNVTFRRSRMYIHSNSASTVRPWYPHNWTGCTMDSNQVYMVMNTGSEQGTMFSACLNNNFKDNHWRISDRGGRTLGIGMGYRDDPVGFFSFVRDTFTDLGPSPVSFQYGSGNVPVNDVSYSYCVFRQGMHMRPAFAVARWTFDHCQIAINNRSGGNSNMISVAGTALTYLTMTHCSILYYRGDGTDVGGKLFASEVDLGTATIRDNVIARMQSQNSSGCPNVSVTKVSSVAGGLGRWNRNVYFLYNKHSATVDSANALVNGSCSKPGANPACGTWGVDCNGRWAGPAASFVYRDTTWNPAAGLPDLTPSNTGLIKHTMWPDGYVGAISAGGGQVDNIAPAAIQNLGAGTGPSPEPSSMAPDDPQGGDGGDRQTPDRPRAPGLEREARDLSEAAIRPGTRTAPRSPSRRP